MFCKTAHWARGSGSACLPHCGEGWLFLFTDMRAVPPSLARRWCLESGPPCIGALIWWNLLLPRPPGKQALLPWWAFVACAEGYTPFQPIRLHSVQLQMSAGFPQQSGPTGFISWGVGSAPLSPYKYNQSATIIRYDYRRSWASSLYCSVLRLNLVDTEQRSPDWSPPSGPQCSLHQHSLS